MTVNITPTPPALIDQDKLDAFETELKKLINNLSMEKYCNLPDHVIAKYFRNSFENLATTQSGNVEFFRL
jgi:hypothetical protein